MTEPRQTLTLPFPSAAMPAMITRLTTYLLHHHYPFLQTRYDAEHVEVEIFGRQNQPIARLRLQATDDAGAASEVLAAATSRRLSADVTRLLHHLLQTD